MADEKRPKVFVSYSWSSEEYQRQVVRLAERLRHDGVDVVIDVWDLRPGHDKYQFMERSVADGTIDKVLILCDRKYAEKANGRKGGVGDETVVITPQVYGQSRQEKFIPVAMEKGADGEAHLPAYLGSRLYIDLSDAAHEKQYKELLHSIYDVPQWEKPSLGSRPSWLSPKHAAPTVGSDAVANPSVKRFADYSWSELERIADEIAAARSDKEGLGVARSYRLVDRDGRLWGDTKPVTLMDKTKAAVRIAGFRHDERVVGGKAGITFEFAGVPMAHRMNAKLTNEGGWEASEMRAWLNWDFRQLLPEDLRSGIVTVRKRTNNAGKVDNEGDTAVVTDTKDGLWLFSSTEIYGDCSTFTYGDETYSIYSAGTYNAEGRQYQLYADQSVSTTNYGFCKKGGANSRWWLRSPYAIISGLFHGVSSDGVWYIDYAAYDYGVSPGFCF